MIEPNIVIPMHYQLLIFLSIWMKSTVFNERDGSGPNPEQETSLRKRIALRLKRHKPFYCNQNRKVCCFRMALLLPDGKFGRIGLGNTCSQS